MKRKPSVRCHSPIKDTWVSDKLLILGLKKEKYDMNLELLVMLKNKKVLKNQKDGGLSKGARAT